MVALKRNAAEDSTTRTPRRVKPTATTMTTLRISNLEDGETIYQQCVLVTGECPSFENSADDYIMIKTVDSMGNSASHNWPVHQGKWKALILLSTGSNHIHASLYHAGGANETINLEVVHQPLLQTPPLHLAILVAKDSPLLIDCPAAKYGAISSAHNSIDAAIAKLRMAAYTWQALTAEDMREKGLGRRAFRLEEEWGLDTSTVQGFVSSTETTSSMKSLAKVHLIRTDKTVAELRDPMYAQQNPSARRPNELHEIFTKALKAHGAPFDSSYRPVVAGLILDSHYSVEQDLILAHAALGAHNRNGISLGIFGSHLTYSWPRFMEEVPACLLDSTAPGDTVGNDNKECSSIARACFVGQGAMLHEVGHAFGADHTEGIMKRGYSKGWGNALLCHASLAPPKQQDNNDNVAEWDLQDVLRFKSMPHFRIPGDEPITKEFLQADIHISGEFDDEVDEEEDEEYEYLHITTAAGTARLEITDGDEAHAKSWYTENLQGTKDFRDYGLSAFDRTKDLKVTVLAMNGKQKTIKNAWRLFKEKMYIPIPGTTLQLQKQSVKSGDLEENDKNDEGRYITWNAMLSKADGTRVNAIDLRVGCTFDGAVVYYNDNTYAHCGPTHRHGSEHRFGGHASQKREMPTGAEVVKVEVNRSGRWHGGSLDGIRMTLDSGDQWGHLNGHQEVHELVPAAGQKIVGFYGTSKKHGYTEEFGIITAPKEIQLSWEVYELPELRNNLVQGASRAEDSDEDEEDEEEDEEMDSQDTM